MELIDRNEAIKAIDDVLMEDEQYKVWLKLSIKNIKPVDAEPVRHGRWIRDEFGTRCGACGLYAYLDKFDQPWESPYCPNCGAKMDAKQEKQYFPKGFFSKERPLAKGEEDGTD